MVQKLAITCHLDYINLIIQLSCTNIFDGCFFLIYVKADLILF